MTAPTDRMRTLDIRRAASDTVFVKNSESVEILSIDGREVRITHPDKPYFSKEVQLLKLDIVRYYLSVAPGALNGIRNRPIVLKRFVDGAEGEAFYQKRAPAARPAWLPTVKLSFPSGRTADEVVVNDAAGHARGEGGAGGNGAQRLAEDQWFPGHAYQRSHPAAIGL